MQDKSICIKQSRQSHSSKPYGLPIPHWPNSRKSFQGKKTYSFSLYFREEHYDKQLTDSSPMFNLDCAMGVLLCRTLTKNKPNQENTHTHIHVPKWVQTLILTVFLQKLDTYLSNDCTFTHSFQSFRHLSSESATPSANQDISSKKGPHKLSKYYLKMTNDKDIHWEELNIQIKAQC